jgi:hypothetical protein
MIKKELELPNVLKLTKSKKIPKKKAKTNNQFSRKRTVRQSKHRKINGIVVRLASKIKAVVKRIRARNFI